MRAGALRAAVIVGAFLSAAIVLMPVQWVLIRLGARTARTLPLAFHRGLCRLLGVRVTVHGPPVAGQGGLLVANHVSWLDIPVLSSILPVSFVAKAEVAGWGMVGTLARLQRTVFVDRTRRSATAPAISAVAERLAGGAGRIGRYAATSQAMGLLNLRSANRAVAGSEPAADSGPVADSEPAADAKATREVPS